MALVQGTAVVEPPPRVPLSASMERAVHRSLALGAATSSVLPETVKRALATQRSLDHPSTFFRLQQATRLERDFEQQVELSAQEFQLCLALNVATYRYRTVQLPASTRQELEAFPGPFIRADGLQVGAPMRRFRMVIRNTSPTTLGLDVQAIGLPCAELRFSPQLMAPGIRKVVELRVHTDVEGEWAGALRIVDLANSNLALEVPVYVRVLDDTAYTVRLQRSPAELRPRTMSRLAMEFCRGTPHELFVRTLHSSSLLSLSGTRPVSAQLPSRSPSVYTGGSGPGTQRSAATPYARVPNARHPVFARNYEPDQCVFAQGAAPHWTVPHNTE